MSINHQLTFLVLTITQPLSCLSWVIVVVTYKPYLTISLSFSCHYLTHVPSTSPFISYPTEFFEAQPLWDIQRRQGCRGVERVDASFGRCGTVVSCLKFAARWIFEIIWGVSTKPQLRKRLHHHFWSILVSFEVPRVTIFPTSLVLCLANCWFDLFKCALKKTIFCS